MLVRAALGAVCASALAAGVLAPVAASASGSRVDELRVRVCKYVDTEDEFDFKGWTDEERKRFTLEDGDCKTLRLDYSRNRFYLREYVDEEDWDVRFRVRGDYDDYEADDYRLKVWFDDEEDEPYLRIKVYNEEF